MIPLFPELQTALAEAWELAEEGSVYVVDERYRKAANTATGWRNINLRTTFEKIVRRAGLKPWPKLFHALRSSRETELAQEFPIHVVTAWLGNTPTVALRHYLLTTDSDFDRATPAKGPAAQTVQISVQQGAEGGGNEPQTPRGNCGISKESGTLHHGATSRGAGNNFCSGGHGTRTRNPLRGTSFPMKLLAIRLPSGDFE